MARTLDVLLADATLTPEERRAFAQELPDMRVHVWPDTPDVVDFAIVWMPPAAMFERIRVRHAIFNLGAGVDTLLAVPTLPRDVPVVRLEDAGMGLLMAEYVMLAVLRAFREQDAYADQQRERRWRGRPRIPKEDFGIGILGFGVLGQAVASYLRAFDFPVCGWTRSPRTVAGVMLFAGEDGLRQVLARSRVLVVMLPLTAETRGVLNRTTLALLPAGAHVVNVARGALIVERDLVELLDEGHLASATLDVFETEPLPSDHQFWHHPKIVLTPHVSGSPLVREQAAQVATKLRALARGESVTGIVDLQRGY